MDSIQLWRAYIEAIGVNTLRGVHKEVGDKMIYAFGHRRGDDQPRCINPLEKMKMLFECLEKAGKHELVKKSIHFLTE